MQAYGAKIDNQTIFEKVFRNLNSKLDHVVAAIEESKIFFEFSFDELMGSLQFMKLESIEILIKWKTTF